MRRRTGLLLLTILACTAAACAPPIGNISGTGGSAAYDALWVVPHRVTYDLGDWFVRDDLSVFASYRGAVYPISVDQVAISIIQDPDYPPFDPILLPNGEYRLMIKGRKEIVVQYSDLSTRYSITVWDPFEIGGDGGQSTDGSGIVVVWMDD